MVTLKRVVINGSMFKWRPVLRRDAIHKDLDRLERWDYVNLVKFNKAKCNILHLGEGNPEQKYKLDREWIESNPEEDLGVLVYEKLNMTW
ncbi:hypothetical protein WISP_60105 [Willisornis vidua]|uniref:Rna-directed dna polymerase from mobile element jockey-like n=1 Tax=Willisornis vidua TaxID=1566151 RepID=A0ABQ9DGR8_9PASS|nr:hypothetical protein WISP_60105 [Willisornis vidua]